MRRNSLIWGQIGFGFVWFALFFCAIRPDENHQVLRLIFHLIGKIVLCGAKNKGEEEKSLSCAYNSGYEYDEQKEKQVQRVKTLGYFQIRQEAEKAFVSYHEKYRVAWRSDNRL